MPGICQKDGAADSVWKAGRIGGGKRAERHPSELVAKRQGVESRNCAVFEFLKHLKWGLLVSAFFYYPDFFPMLPSFSSFVMLATTSIIKIFPQAWFAGTIEKINLQQNKKGTPPIRAFLLWRRVLHLYIYIFWIRLICRNMPCGRALPARRRAGVSG